MRLTVLSADDLRHALPMARAVEAMKEALAALSAGTAQVPQRLAVGLDQDAGTLLVKPAQIPGHGAGAKLVAVAPGNRTRGLPVTSGLMLLVDPVTGQPAALLDGTFLTAWRTAATAAAATDLLALAEARRAAIFGCGGQARTQVLGLAAVRELDEIRIFARTRSAVDGFIDELAPQVGCRLVAAASPAAALDRAEVVVTATTSHEPVFEGRQLAPGTHVNGIGSFTPDMREVDEHTVRRAAVFVERRAEALAEAGELIAAQGAGHTSANGWTEIGEVVLGRQPGRASQSQITFFKSVGSAAQDVVAAAAAVAEAKRLGLGSELRL